MIKVSVLKNGIETNGAKFETQELATAWINECKANGAWGKAAGSYSLMSLSEQELASEISRVTSLDGSILVTIPDQFTVVQTDITAQVNAEHAQKQLVQNIYVRLSELDLDQPLTDEMIRNVLKDIRELLKAR